MAERLHRTEILLEPEQHRKLADLAEREGRSLSEIVRGMLKQELERREPDRRSRPAEPRDPLARLRRFHEEMRARRGGSPVVVDVEELIRDMRDERDEEILAGLRPPRP